MLLYIRTLRKLPKALIFRRDLILIVLFFIFVTILVFAPAIYRPSIFQVFGGDVYHNLWIWGRNVSNVMTGSAPYAPNIFFPDPLSSFYSEMEIGNSLLYGFFSAIGLHPILSYLVIAILAFALTGIMVALIARRLGASTTGGILGGSITAFASYHYLQLPHIQLLAIYWLLIPLYFSLSYLIDGKRRDLFLTGFTHIPILCGPSYNLIGLFLLESGIFLAFALNKSIDVRLRLRRAGSLTLAVIFALLPTIPFWLGYFKLFMRGVSRVSTEFAAFRIDLLSFFTPPSGSVIYGYASKLIDAAGQQALSINAFFIGFVALGLIVLALFRRPPLISAMPDGATDTSRYLLTVKWIGIVLLALSLGEVVVWHNLYIMPNPIFKIAEKTHFLSATRYVADYAFLALAAFSIIVACYFSELPKNIKKANRSKLHIGIAILIVLENYVNYAPNPSRFPPTLSEPPLVYNQLAKLPSGKAVVFLPLPIEISLSDGAFWRQFEYMFYINKTRLSLFNGNSGFFPPLYAQGIGILAEFPNLPGLNFIIENRIDYVVYDRHSTRVLDFSDEKMELLCGALSLIYSDNDYEVFQVDPVRGQTCIKRARGPTKTQFFSSVYTILPH